MSKEESESPGVTVVSTLAALPLLLAFAWLSTLWEAYALRLTWGWLAVPAGLPDWPLRTWFMFSLGLTVTTHQVSRSKEELEGKAFAKRAMVASVLSPASLIALGALARWILP